MAVGGAKSNPFDDYEYLNENFIDAELKCALCFLPFQSPTSGTCGHTFCQECVHPWVNRQSTCPTCRIRSSTEEFRPISTRIVINQLDRLLLRCKRCNQSNILRGDINEHEKRCPNQLVSCPAFDIKCPWKGTRNALTKHLDECSFQKIRPVINDLYEHLKNLYEPLVDELQTVRQQLQTQMTQIQDQNRFLLAVFNKGKPMTEGCSVQQISCPFQNKSIMQYRNQRNQQDESSYRQTENQISMVNEAVLADIRQQARLRVNQLGRDSSTPNLLNCANCHNGVQPTDVSLHHCQGGVICRLCFDNYGQLDSTSTKLPKA